MVLSGLRKAMVGATAALAMTASSAFAEGANDHAPQIEQAAHHTQADIILRYGDRITENMDNYILSLNQSNISAAAELGLEDPNCVAIIHNGEEIRRFSEETLKSGRVLAVAERIMEGKPLRRSANSDCPILSAELG